MNITINIQAPELAHALETLAIAIGCTVDKIGLGEAIKDAVAQGPSNVTDKPIKKEAKTTEKVTDNEEVLAEEPQSDPETTYTIELVREAFMAKNSKTNTAKLKAILKKYSVAKVTDLTEESFADVIKELEAI
jgi:hypothetical protein